VELMPPALWLVRSVYKYKGGAEGKVKQESSKSIVDLPAMVEGFPPEERARFRRMFAISEVVGELRVPPSMRQWVEQRFGSVKAVERQRIVRVTNLFTLESALFNDLRSSRPFEACENAELAELIRQTEGDPFCRPWAGTPEDVFGRIEGTQSVTASNIAKYDGFHGLVIFKEHDPLRWDEEAIVDYFAVAMRWAEQAHAVDPTARYFFLMWNCLWKSGASVLHGHMQMTLARDMHYAKVESMRRAALSFQQAHNQPYFDELWHLHDLLGLSWHNGGTRGLVYLAPVKEKEVWIWADQYGEELARATYRALTALVLDLGVRSFNMAVYMPPIGSGPTTEEWEGFPVLVRLVDRGDLSTRVADFGAMEIYAASVVASDPFVVARTILEREEAFSLRESGLEAERG